MQKREPTFADMVSLRTAHLSMIQGVVSRVSSFSAAVKNFAVTVLVALTVFAFEKRAAAPLWAATVAVTAFLIMDGYYHLLEVRYRELHKATAKRPIEQGSDMLLEAPGPTWANLRKVIGSKTFLPFYVLLLFAMWFALEEAIDDQQTNPRAARDIAGFSERLSASKERVVQPDRQSGAVDQRVGGTIPTDPNKANGHRNVR